MTPADKRRHDRERRIQRKYGLTPEQWQALMDAQHNRCRACMKHFGDSRLPCVDHDHRSGLVRGLLCAPCNYAIGERHDDADWFNNVAMYLNSPIAVDVIGYHYIPGSAGEAGVFSDGNGSRAGAGA